MKKLFYLSIAFIGLVICPNSFVNAQGLGVNTTGAPADNSAGIDIDFVDKGMLLPRMTTSQRDAISNPATGLTIFNTDCQLYNYNSGTPGAPNWAIVNSPNAITAGVTISSNPQVICGGSSATFTAVASGGLTSPVYQWKVNGSNVGSGGTTYSTSSLASGDVVTCVLTTTQTCVIGVPATSNSIVVSSSLPAAPSTITPPAVACQDSQSGNTYTATIVPGATQYNWVLPVGGNCFITAGLGTNALSLGFKDTVGNIGSLSVTASNACGVSAATVSAPIVLAHKTPHPPGAITGVVNSFINAANVPYSIAPVTFASYYTWSSPVGTITGGQGTTNASITFGSTLGTNNIYVTAGNTCGVSAPDSIAVTLCTYSPGSQTFTYTGGMVTWTAPCATSVTITAIGAAGANTGCCNYGFGGSASGNLTITPGETLYVTVGGVGGSGISYAAGYNGGGGGGTSNQYRSYLGSDYYGAGGGGASDVRVGGTGLTNRVIVGGGGGGTSNFGSNGGGGGGYTGGDATLSQELTETVSNCYFGCSYTYYVMYTTGGHGGTSGSGGTGGTCGQCPWSGTSGTQGSSGTGGGSDGYINGGGGGGYYGGGSGATSFNSGQNWWTSSSGGGGSSYTGSLGNASTTGDINGPSDGYSGNGAVIISW